MAYRQQNPASRTTRLSAPQKHIGHVANRATAAVVRALVHGEQSAVRKEAKPVGVSESPRNQLQITAVFVAAHDGRGAGQLRRNALPRLGALAEWRESSGLSRCVRQVAKRIRCFDVYAVEDDVVTGKIVIVRQPAQPTEFVSVESDDPRVGQRALTEIQLGCGTAWGPNATMFVW